MKTVDDPLVSIILPTYNGSKWLAEAIYSVLGQTHQDFEVIAVDNGSTDDSVALLSSYPDRIRILFEKKKGVSFARNAGLLAARGEYVAFLDQDDIWLPDKLSAQIDVFAGSETVGMVGCSFYSIDDNSNIIEVFRKTVAEQESLAKELFVRNRVGPPSCMLIRKSVVDQVGVFDEDLNGVEDRDLWMRITERYQLRFVERPLVKYRLHPQNVHKNVPLMKASQKRFIQKHRHKQSALQLRKAYGYVYVEAAKQYWGQSERAKAFCEAVKAIIRYPLPVISEDDKWKILVASLLPRKVLTVLSNTRKRFRAQERS
jgi:glycosyltransferase involved in cell wall biosynthesis